MNLLTSFFAILLLTTQAAVAGILDQQPYDRVLGHDDAPVTMVEYSSLSCPHCAQFHNEIFPELKEKYIDSGKLRLLARNYPINEPALRGSMLTMCVPDDKYYPFLKVLFSMQKKWAMSVDFMDSLKQIAKVGGVSEVEFDACMENEGVEKKVLEIKRDATEQLDIEATPTFYINGEKVQGARSLEDFSKVIDAKLAETE